MNEETPTHKVCFVLGLDKFINCLEENVNSGREEEDYQEGTELFAQVIQRCEESERFSFIIVDTASKIKEHNYDEWYSQNVIQENIIWVGSGIEDQYLLDINAPRKEIVDNCGCSFGYINKKNKTIMMKLLEMKERREEDE